MSITILLEIGHEASLRTKTTTEGFTHDWEVYVRGCNGAEIQYYVEKVVFHLHETFAKPKRVVKEAPYSLKTSGYAGFNLPIDIYLKNTQEPRKIRFNYDLQLQPTGPTMYKVRKEKYVFSYPSEEFRNKLLKGGAVVGSTGVVQDILESRSNIDDKNQMTSKPKLGGSDVMKKPKYRPEEQRDSFRDLFGTPITKTSKPEPPKPKESTKNVTSKSDKATDKTKIKSPHKDRDKIKDKQSSEHDKKSKEDKKNKEKTKERDRSKEKSSKKDKDKSPTFCGRSATPKRSPKRSGSKEKETAPKDKDQRDRKEEKKLKKEKREHKENKHKDRDKTESGGHKDGKHKESKMGGRDVVGVAGVKENMKDVSPVPPTSIQIAQQKLSGDKKDKSRDKELSKEEEKLRSDGKFETAAAEKPKHKHKKKDKDRKEKKEEKSHKNLEKKLEKSSTGTVKENGKELATTKDSDKTSSDHNLFGSPKNDSALPPPSMADAPAPPPKKDKPPNSLLVDEDSSNSSTKNHSSREPSPIPEPLTLLHDPLPPPLPKKTDDTKKNRDEAKDKRKEKRERKKEKKSEKELEKKRKRKADNIKLESSDVEVGPLPPPIKRERHDDLVNNNSDDERKVSSSEDAAGCLATTTVVKNETEDYMGTLRDLQHKIMGLRDNSDLQKVVQLIAETGRYEVSAHTFDFDLCLLDRSTVRQLQDFFSTIS